MPLVYDMKSLFAKGVRSTFNSTKKIKGKDRITMFQSQKSAFWGNILILKHRENNER